MTKKKFIKYMKVLRAWSEYSDKCYKVGLNFLEQKGAVNLENAFVELLEEACGIKEDSWGYSDISYFAYELDYGKKWKPGTITEADGTDIKMETAEDLWDYIQSCKKD